MSEPQSLPFIKFFQDSQELKRRRLSYLKTVSKEIIAHYSSKGKWNGEGEIGFREHHWACLALYSQGKKEVALANVIMESLTPDRNDFTGFFSPLMLRLYQDRMTERSQEICLQAWEERLEHSFKHLFSFTENCGLMNAYGLMEHYQRSHDVRYRDRVIDFLDYLLHYFVDNSFTREFLSPNYLPVSLTGVGALHAFTCDSEIRKKALRLQHFYWEEAALLWHPELKFSTGASGRSYIYNSIPSYSLQHLMQWIAVGEPTALSPEKYGLFNLKRKDAMVEGYRSFAQLHGAVHAVIPYSLPKVFNALSTQRSYPFQMEGRADLVAFRGFERREVTQEQTELQGGWFAGHSLAAGPGQASVSSKGVGFIPTQVLYPCGKTIIQNYQTKEYAVGTATKRMTGQTNPLQVVWKTKKSVQGYQDLRTLFTRYVLNDSLEKTFGRPDYQINLNDAGRGGATQNESMAIQWMTPTDDFLEPLQQFGTSVIISELVSPVKKIFIHDRSWDGRTSFLSEEGWVMIDEGDVYLAIKGLVLNKKKLNSEVEIRRYHRFLTINFWNYRGEPLEMSPAERWMTGGGVVVLIGNRSEFKGGFREFQKSVQAAEIKDHEYLGKRSISVKWNQKSLEVLWQMQTEYLYSIKKDGKYYNAPRLKFG